jgi:hypothetical protein
VHSDALKVKIASGLHCSQLNYRGLTAEEMEKEAMMRYGVLRMMRYDEI